MSHSYVVVDKILEQLEAAKSGIVPGSVEQSIVAGIQNVPAQIKQARTGQGSGTAYTTFPLSPIVKNCCIDKSYLNLEYDINFILHLEGLIANKKFWLPLNFGHRDTPSILNQIQILIENTTIWQTVYQREEATLAYSTLPGTEIRGNNQYSSIEKMKNHVYSPMKRIIVQGTADGNGKADVPICQHFKVSIDLNRLTPILSDLHFTTKHMGNLRLKVFIQQIEQALFFCPDYNWEYHQKANASAAGSALTKAQINALINSTVGTPKYVDYWAFYPLAEYMDKDIPSSKIPFVALSGDGDSAGDEYQLINPSVVKFQNPTGTTDFMTFANGGIAEIVQTNFEIMDAEYERLNSHFTALGSVIIPVHTWSTSVFNNSEIKAGNWNTSMIGNVGGYNINHTQVWFHSNASPCALHKEFLNGVQLLIDGRPINMIRYPYINERAIVDFTQALIDTDHEEINEDYIASLSFLNLTDTEAYINESAHATYGDGLITIDRTEGTESATFSYTKGELRNPNCFSMAFSTNLPDAFHSGACILENSNRQAVIRLLSDTAEKTGSPFTIDRNKFPLYETHNTISSGTTAGFSCFCDACIVLTYDAARGTSYDGQLSWAAPYI